VEPREGQVPRRALEQTYIETGKVKVIVLSAHGKEAVVAILANGDLASVPRIPWSLSNKAWPPAQTAKPEPIDIRDWTILGDVSRKPRKWFTEVGRCAHSPGALRLLSSGEQY
jgi:hypothetical protein